MSTVDQYLRKIARSLKEPVLGSIGMQHRLAMAVLV